MAERGGLHRTAIGCERVPQGHSRHHARGDLGDRHADCLGDERHGAARARVHFDDEDRPVLDRELHVHQAAHVQGARERFGLARQFPDDLIRQRVHGQGASRIARMDARFLDMLHDARDQAVRAVGEAIDIDLSRARQVAVDQDR